MHGILKILLNITDFNKIYDGVGSFVDTAGGKEAEGV